MQFLAFNAVDLFLDKGDYFFYGWVEYSPHIFPGQEKTAISYPARRVIWYSGDWTGVKFIVFRVRKRS